MKKPATKAIYILVITAGITFSMLHMIHWADSVAQYTNYFFSLGVLPFVVGLLFGCVGSIVLEKNLFKNWKIKATGALAPLVPIFYVIGIMTFTSH